ncbi:hypothetical protein HZS_745, partial [Henneguya salminicola]
MLDPFAKRWKAAQSFCYLNELFGEVTSSKSQSKEWFVRVKANDSNLKNKPVRGRPSDFHNLELFVTVEEEKSLTTRMLAEYFNVYHSTIVRRSKKFGKILNGVRGVTRELPDNNKAERIRILTDLLQQNEQA